eukprot:IDg23017t1
MVVLELDENAARDLLPLASCEGH